MLKFSKSVALALALAFAPVTVSTTSWAEELRAAKQPGEWLASSVMGATVKNKEAKAVGDINDIVLNKDGAITAYVVGVGGFLGIAEKNVAVAASDIDVSWKKDGNAVITANASKEALEKAPEFKRVSKVEKAMKKAKEKANEAVESAKEALEAAGDKVEEATDKASE